MPNLKDLGMLLQLRIMGKLTDEQLTHYRDALLKGEKLDHILAQLGLFAEPPSPET
jgi:hypothetical protein